MRIQRVAALLGLLALVPVATRAQFHNAKYASEFLSLGAGARAAAIGGAGTAASSDVTAGYYNPAGLSELPYLQLSIFHESRFAGQINYDYAGAALPLDSLQTVGISAIRVGMDGIKDSRGALIDANGNGRLDEDERLDESKIKTGGAADYAFLGSYARLINDRLSVGGNVKLLYRTVLDNSAWGLGFDLSARYRPVPDLALAATLQDATKSLLAWDTGNQEFIVPQLRLGAAWRLRIGEMHSVVPAVDGVFRFEGRSSATMADLGIASLDLAGGLEYSYRDRVFVRAGYSELQQLTVGAGVRLPKLNIDYAFIKESNDEAGLGPTHRISLVLTLDEAKFAR